MRRLAIHKFLFRKFIFDKKGYTEGEKYDTIGERLRGERPEKEIVCRRAQPRTVYIDIKLQMGKTGRKAQKCTVGRVVYFLRGGSFRIMLRFADRKENVWQKN